MKVISLDNLKYLVQYLKTTFIAQRASCDASGNDIESTYLKKADKAAEAAHADTADNADNASIATKAVNDGLGRNIAKTYLSADGGKISGELHLENPAEDDNSDKPATTSWVTTQISKAVPSKKTDGSMQTWDINVSGSAATAKEADHAKTSDAMGIQKVLGDTSDKPYAAMVYTDFTEMGVYKIFYASGDALPPGCNGDIWVFNMYHGDPKYSSMIAVSPRVNQMYTGHFTNGKWNGWKKIANMDDITVDAPTKTGGGASGTWSINISGNAATATNATNATHAKTADSATSAVSVVSVFNDYKNMKMHWNGQNGQPPWLWGGADGENMYVYNPANFTVAVAKNVPTSDVGGNFWIT